MIEPPARICIIDVHQSYAEMLSAVLQDGEPQLHVEVFASWDDFQRQKSAQSCDLCLVDHVSNKRSPLSFLKKLGNDATKRKIVVLTARWSSFLLHTALSVGVCGYLLKQESVDQLCKRLRSDPHHGCVLSEPLRELVTRNPKSGQYQLQTPHPLADLTDDQLRLVEHLVDGGSVKEIANRLDVSYKSLDSQKYRLMNRLGISNRIDLVRMAIREGICLP